MVSNNQRDSESLIMRDIVVRNQELLESMAAVARAEPVQCAALYDCAVSAAKVLASLTPAQLERAASCGRLLFRPAFDSTDLPRLADPSGSPLPSSKVLEPFMREIALRNQELLDSMVAAARVDPALCAAHFDCSMSAVDVLAAMSPAQIKCAAGCGKVLFKPVFGGDELRQFAESDVSSNPAVQSELQAAAQALAPRSTSARG